MTKAQIRARIKDLRENIFYLEMDDFAYTNGNGATIRAMENEIKDLEKELKK